MSHISLHRTECLSYLSPPSLTSAATYLLKAPWSTLPKAGVEWVPQGSVNVEDRTQAGLKLSW